MTKPPEMLLGEFRRTLDQRYRLAIPDEFRDRLELDSAECVLAKERLGCISLWNPRVWNDKVKMWIDMASDKIDRGVHDGEIGQVQLLGRLLSTRHESVAVKDGGRVVIPKGFRDFLGVLPEGPDADDQSGGKRKTVMVVGAAVCIEIWNPPNWLKYLEGRMPKFRGLVKKLS